MDAVTILLATTAILSALALIAIAVYVLAPPRAPVSTQTAGGYAVTLRPYDGRPARLERELAEQRRALDKLGVKYAHPLVAHTYAQGGRDTFEAGLVLYDATREALRELAGGHTLASVERKEYIVARYPARRAGAILRNPARIVAGMKRLARAQGRRPARLYEIYNVADQHLELLLDTEPAANAHTP